MKQNNIEFEVIGDNAMFTDPITKIGGERCSYSVPTYSAIRGILENIYWKPTIKWVVDSVRVVNPIRTESKSVKPRYFSSEGQGISCYSYLKDVRYQVKAHFEWNLQRSDLEQDRNEIKHSTIIKRSLEKGGRKPIFLGNSECIAFVKPIKFGEGEGYYDNTGLINLGFMFNGFEYPDETPYDTVVKSFDTYQMINGVITYNQPCNCKIRETINNIRLKEGTYEPIQ